MTEVETKPGDDATELQAVELQAIEQHLIEQGFSREGGFGAVRWIGQRNGRAVELSVARQARTRYAGEVRYRKQLGFVLNVRMATPIMTRLSFIRAGISQQPWVRWIHRGFGRDQVDAAPAGLKGFCAVAADRGWAERLLADQRLTSVMPDLLAGQAAVGHKSASVQFNPGELLYISPTLQREDFTVERVQPILDRLSDLASVAEALPAPEQTSQLSSFERLGRENPRKLAWLIICGLFAAILMSSAVLIGIALWFATR